MTDKELIKEVETLGRLVLAQREQLVKLPGPVATAQRLFKRFNAAELDTLQAELMRLAERAAKG